MSGGSLNYFYSSLEDHIGDFKDKELDDLVTDLAKLFYEREWYLSADTCEGDWNEARDAFKKKWFSDGSRLERVAKYLDDIREEVLKQFGLSNHYCKNCSHWTQDKGFDEYGDCELTKGCMMHRSESCDQFIPAEIKEVKVG